MIASLNFTIGNKVFHSGGMKGLRHCQYAGLSGWRGFIYISSSFIHFRIITIINTVLRRNTHMLDNIIPRQRMMSTRLGGFLMLISETMFLFSVMNFIMITRIQYYSAEDSYMRSLFPDYIYFLVALSLIALSGMWFAYVFIIPSKQKFSQEQAVKDARSPTYNRLLEMHEDLTRIEASILSLNQRLDSMQNNQSSPGK